MKINSYDRTVKNILETGYYRVPRFQRPYEWTVENVDDFWTDTVAESSGEYFIGSVIVFPTSDDTFDIVDGQQRLTTITILLAALRDTFANLDDGSLATGLHKYVERPDVNDKLQYVLQTETSYPYLHEYIQKFGDPDEELKLGAEEQALEAAFRYFTDQLAKVVDGIVGDPSTATDVKRRKASQRLTEIRDQVLALSLIFVKVDTEDDAYVIFETLNSRGKDLTTADLLKNFFLKDQPQKNAKVDLPRDKWSKLLETLDGSAVPIRPDSFFHHSWLSRREYVSEKVLFRTIKRSVKKPARAALLNTFLSEAELYRAIVEPSYRTWKKEEAPLRRSVEALGIFRVQQPYPFVLSVLRAYVSGGIRLAVAGKALRGVESFHFMFTAVTGLSSSGGITKMYALHARNLLSAATPQARVNEIDALLDKLRDRLPGVGQFDSAFAQLEYTSKFTQQKQLIKYALSEIYRTNASGAAPDFDLMTLEHIRPESSGDAGVGMIGNLMLVDEPLNNALGSKSFADKQSILAKTNNVWIDPTVVAAKRWVHSNMLGRGVAMAQEGYSKTWKF